ncbi:MAG: Ig-like domain-containing protein [Candidatus Sulfotelmatobacter sp.]
MTFGFRYALALLLAASLISTVSCAHDQQLVSISVEPGTETFGSSNTPVNDDAGLTVQLRAIGTYIHPPVTKDITNQVTWTSNDTQMVTVNSTGLVTATGDTCGGSIVSATVQTNTSSGEITSSGAIVTGEMQADVTCYVPTPANPASQATLTANLAGAGLGSVASKPFGIDCANTCTANFATATVINLTAIANSGSTFAGWTGCDSVMGQTCIINKLNPHQTVTATFN